MDKQNDNAKHGHFLDRAFLFSHLEQPGSVLLESSRQDPLNKKQYLFHSPIEILTASTLNEIPEVFRRIEYHRTQGRWFAGYAAYECGYHFDTVIHSFTNSGTLPLIWFGVYSSPTSLSAELLDGILLDDTPSIVDPRMTIDARDYSTTIDRIKEYIVNGDTYQVNFTDRYEFGHSGKPHDLYFALRQKQHVPYGAFLNTGAAQILSFSPELFFRRNGRTITTTPMKGTSRRGKNSEEDEQLSVWLRNDEKNRSENLMIVDLLRNDIGRICENGSVRVTEMYAVERFETVLQMTSTVSGTVKPDVTYYDMFKALFPCGSVTGAPKIRTMQIIHELERHPRGVYCGAIGYIAPDDQAVFSVAIRTITLTGTTGVMGVGSGIVYDSVAEKEYEECQIKAAFLLHTPPEFQLLETLSWNNDYTFLHQHLARLKASADYFQIPFHEQTLLDALNATTRSLKRNIIYRIRLLLFRSGIVTVEASEHIPSATSIIKLAEERTSSADTFLYHKTTNRALYDRYRTIAMNEGVTDYIFRNEDGEITEGSVTNIFIEKEGKLCTPPIQCGVLPGIYRSEVLRTNPAAVEKIIKFDDLMNADAVYICNSVRGWSKVTLSE